MSLFLFNKEASQMAFSILSRWVSRTPETALQELLDGRPFFPNNRVFFFSFFDFNGFWRENDVKRLTV